MTQYRIQLKFDDFTWATNSINLFLNDADFHIFVKSCSNNNVLLKNPQKKIY